jgi:hypothetical protein
MSPGAVALENEAEALPSDALPRSGERGARTPDRRRLIPMTSVASPAARSHLDNLRYGERDEQR